MKYPSLGEYQEAVQAPRLAFSDPDLQRCQPEPNNWGLPKVASGGFALTFHLLSTVGKEEWAVRCFHKDISNLEDRYRCISLFLRTHSSNRFVRFEYQPQGIRVHGSRYPIVKMEWVRGSPLNQYVQSVLSSPGKIHSIAEDFRVMVGELEKLGVAHGDLQHGNILVADRLYLVDYDGMFVPGIGLPSSEVGHVNYQHPGRTGKHFDENIDRFSTIVIYLALMALESYPALWSQFDTGENLLFTARDFNDPDNSVLLRHLQTLEKTRVLAQRFARLCRSDISAVPRLEDFLSNKVVVLPAKEVVAKPSTPKLKQYPVLRAEDRAALWMHIGDVVEVVGTVIHVHQDVGRTGEYALLNFGGRYPNHTFTVPLWRENLKALRADGKSPGDFQGRVVSVVGLLQTYVSRGRRFPEIQPENINKIRILRSEEEVSELMGSEVSTNRVQAPSSNQDILKTLDTGKTVTVVPVYSQVTSATSASRPRENAKVIGQLMSANTSTSGRLSSAGRPAASQTGGQSSQSAGWCFVASAVFGYDAYETWVLRSFRDSVLMTSRIGRLAVRFYYWLSPPIAGWLQRCSPARRLAARILCAFVRRVEHSHANGSVVVRREETFIWDGDSEDP